MTKHKVESMCLDYKATMLSNEDFFKSLYKAYQGLLVETRGSPYVPIPKVRDKVCKETRIWPADFDKSLVAMPKETPEYLVHLSEPMLRQSDGIRLGGKYLYYIGIWCFRCSVP